MAPAITAEEIKEIRGKYGLSQKSFALLLGIGPASMVRYEQGVQPSKANANLIRAARIPQFMQECLQNDGDLIPSKQRAVAERVSYALVRFDAETGEPEFTDKTPYDEPKYTMDEMYHFTLQQEILNEQAANLIADIMQAMLLNGESVSSEEPSPRSLLLSQLYEVKRSIIAPGSDDDELLEQVRGYLRYLTPYVEKLCTMGEVA